MYVLNFASWRDVDLRTLIHELAHTWQGVVTGPIYIIEALHAQFKLGPDAYRVTLDDLEANAGDFSLFNPEQQARIVDLYYEYRFGSRRSRSEADTWVEALAPYARQVYRAPSSRRSRIRPIALDLTRFNRAIARTVSNAR